MNELQSIQEWYASQCNGDWEHSFGVEIGSLDNPGWLLKIDLLETNLNGQFFEPIVRGDSENGSDWIHCKVESGKFIGAGGVHNLTELLTLFLGWAGQSSRLTHHSSGTPNGAP